MYVHGPASPCARPDPTPLTSLLPLASLPSPLAAQRTGEKRMCSPVYLLMPPVCEKLALPTGNTEWARAVQCLAALADGAEGLVLSS